MAMPRNRHPESGPTDLTGMLLRHVPPHNLDAEQAVLGGVLIKPSILDKLGIELRRVDFYDPRHQVIWDAMGGLWRENKPVDLITLAAALTAAGQLDKAGGPAYLGELAGCILSAANTLHPAGIMRALSKRRSMAIMGRRIIEIAYDPERDPAEFVSIAQTASDAVLNPFHPYAKRLRTFNERLTAQGRPRITLRPAPGVGAGGQLHADLAPYLTARVVGRSALVLGRQDLVAQVEDAGRDIRRHIEDFPAVAALLWGIAYCDERKPAIGRRQTRSGSADTVAGY